MNPLLRADVYIEVCSSARRSGVFRARDFFGAPDGAEDAEGDGEGGFAGAFEEGELRGERVEFVGGVVACDDVRGDQCDEGFAPAESAEWVSSADDCDCGEECGLRRRECDADYLRGRPHADRPHRKIDGAERKALAEDAWIRQNALAALEESTQEWGATDEEHRDGTEHDAEGVGREPHPVEENLLATEWDLNKSGSECGAE